MEKQNVKREKERDRRECVSEILYTGKRERDVYKRQWYNG